MDILTLIDDRAAGGYAYLSPSVIQRKTLDTPDATRINNMFGSKTLHTDHDTNLRQKHSKKNKNKQGRVLGSCPAYSVGIEELKLHHHWFWIYFKMSVGELETVCFTDVGA